MAISLAKAVAKVLDTGVPLLALGYEISIESE